jgi:hypothetical protein
LINRSNLSGQRFGMLLVVQRDVTKNGPNSYWTCLCDCGKSVVICRPSLRKKTSCGCDTKRLIGLATATHRRTRTPLYRVWSTMIDRCHRPNTTSYPRYGARGIRVCERWRHSFENFLADMGERPSDSHSIDRIDSNGNYCPENCRWATMTEQARNTRANRIIEFDGVTLCLIEWAERTGIEAGTIARRLRTGWSVSDALTTPARPHREYAQRAHVEAEETAVRSVNTTAGRVQDVC